MLACRNPAGADPRMLLEVAETLGIQLSENERTNSVLLCLALSGYWKALLPLEQRRDVSSRGSDIQTPAKRLKTV
jgi:hypothetical protein